MTTPFAQKRKRDSEGEQSEEGNKLSGLQLYLLKKQKRTQKNQSTKDKPILIENLRKLPKLEKGFVNLPKDILVEALLYVKNIKLSLTSSKGDQGTYYKCVEDQCLYRLKIEEHNEKLKLLTTTSLISNFKNIDISHESDLEEGICFLTEYGEHGNHSKELESSKYKNTKAGKN